MKPEAENRLGRAKAALRAGSPLYEMMGAPLYANLCERGARDVDIVELMSWGREGAAPMHLFSSVHYLLLQDPSDPLSQFFSTLEPNPRPAADAFPAFARYCKEHRNDILRLLRTRTVQTTYVERCKTVMPLVSYVAAEAGEPLNLVEIGCSAGVLLTFDKYAYELCDGVRLGTANAPLTLPVRVVGGRPLRIPQIGARIGLDLHIVDPRSADERRWLLALSFPEHHKQQAALAIALETVALTPMQMIEGDALFTLPAVLAETSGALCVLHSACLMYWPLPAKAALDALLVDASRTRSIYRVAMEPVDRVELQHRGQKEGSEQASQAAPIRGEAVITRYRDAVTDRLARARTVPDYGSVEWLE